MKKSRQMQANHTHALIAASLGLQLCTVSAAPASQTSALTTIEATSASGQAAGLSSDLHARIDAKAREIESKLIAWRRDIHQHPELGNQEVRTAKLVADHLRSLGMEVETGVAVTGVVGLLKGGKPGPVVALRADMDALPIQEQVDLPFASKAKGTHLGKEVSIMHACGHDTHTAMLMAAAEVLASMKDELPGSVKFIFQPAEETPADFEPDGTKVWGAKQMIQQGVMDNPKVDAVFGLHVSSAYEAGKLYWRTGPAMAAVDQFRIKLTGKQTHGGLPWLGVDPIVTGSQLVMGLQTIVSRQVNLAQEPAVVTVGTFHAGNRMNIVPDSAEMTGTIRTYDDEMKKDIHRRIQQTAESIAQSAGAKAEVKVVELYNVVNNPADFTEKMAPTLRRVAGEGNYGLQPKLSASEDFSFYQEKAPGMFFDLGITPRGTDVSKAAPNHSPLFYVDESALITGVRALSNLAVDYLAMAQQSK